MMTHIIQYKEQLQSQGVRDTSINFRDIPNALFEFMRRSKIAIEDGNDDAKDRSSVGFSGSGNTVTDKAREKGARQQSVKGGQGLADETSESNIGMDSLQSEGNKITRKAAVEYNFGAMAKAADVSNRELVLETYADVWASYVRGSSDPRSMSVAAVLLKVCSKKRAPQKAVDTRLRSLFDTIRSSGSNVEDNSHFLLAGKAFGMFPRPQDKDRPVLGFLITSLLVMLTCERCLKNEELLSGDMQPSPTEFKTRLAKLLPRVVPVKRVLNAVRVLLERHEPHWCMAPLKATCVEYGTETPWSRSGIARLTRLLTLVERAGAEDGVGACGVFRTVPSLASSVWSELTEGIGGFASAIAACGSQSMDLAVAVYACVTAWETEFQHTNFNIQETVQDHLSRDNVSEVSYSGVRLSVAERKAIVRIRDFFDGKQMAPDWDEVRRCAIERKFLFTVPGSLLAKDSAELSYHLEESQKDVRVKSWREVNENAVRVTSQHLPSTETPFPNDSRRGSGADREDASTADSSLFALEVAGELGGASDAYLSDNPGLGLRAEDADRLPTLSGCYTGDKYLRQSFTLQKLGIILASPRDQLLPLPPVDTHESISKTRAMLRESHNSPAIPVVKYKYARAIPSSWASPLPGRHQPCIVDLLSKNHELLEKLQLLSPVAKPTMQSPNDSDLAADSSSQPGVETYTSSNSFDKAAVDESALRSQSRQRRRRQGVADSHDEMSPFSMHSPLRSSVDLSQLRVQATTDANGGTGSGTRDLQSMNCILLRNSGLTREVLAGVVLKYAKPFQMKYLLKIDVSANRLGRTGIAPLVSAFKSFCQLSDLNVADNALGDAGVNELLVAIKTGDGARALRKLDISSNDITLATDDLYALDEFNQIRVLNLSYNRISTDTKTQRDMLYSLINTSTSLQILSLACNRLADKGATIALASCTTVASLLVLDLAHCFLTDAILGELKKFLQGRAEVLVLHGIALNPKRTDELLEFSKGLGKSVLLDGHYSGMELALRFEA